MWPDDGRRDQDMSLSELFSVLIGTLQCTAKLKCQDTHLVGKL